MEFEVGAVTIFALSLGRTSAWVAASPLFSANGLAAVGRLAFAIALALLATPIGAGPPPPDSLGAFIGLLAGQIALGLVMGWITGLALAVFQSAGTIVDMTSGFSVGSLLDPSTGVRAAIMSRFFSMAFLALFFATNAHLIVVGGFVRSFRASPVTQMPLLGAENVAMAAQSMSDLLVAALEIAAPVLAALLIAEAALALAARFVPQANVFVLGLPLKLGIATTGVASLVGFFPVYTERVVERITELMLATVT